jgi:hypothetical protein
MLRIERTLAALSLAVVVVGSVVGCMDLTTAPVTRNTGVVVANGRAASSAGLLTTTSTLIDGVASLLVKVINIVGDVGGSLTNGRWRVDVPPGAIDGTAAVSVGVSSLTSSRCSLQIAPLSKNHFANPVRLTVDCSGVPTGQLKTYVIYWYNPSRGTWDPVEGSVVDLNHKTVSAPLQHFSTYATGPAGGKVGW